MAIILDADVIIQGEKRRFDFENWLASRTTDVFEIAAITIAEVWHGVERGKGVHRWSDKTTWNRFEVAHHIVPYTAQTAYEHARLWAQLEGSGRMIGFYDLIVAATALEREASWLRSISSIFRESKA